MRGHREELQEEPQSGRRAGGQQHAQLEPAQGVACEREANEPQGEPLRVRLDALDRPRFRSRRCAQRWDRKMRETGCADDRGDTRDPRGDAPTVGAHSKRSRQTDRNPQGTTCEIGSTARTLLQILARVDAIEVQLQRHQFWCWESAHRLETVRWTAEEQARVLNEVKCDLTAIDERIANTFESVHDKRGVEPPRVEMTMSTCGVQTEEVKVAYEPERVETGIPGGDARASARYDKARVGAEEMRRKATRTSTSTKGREQAWSGHGWSENRDDAWRQWRWWKDRWTSFTWNG